MGVAEIAEDTPEVLELIESLDACLGLVEVESKVYPGLDRSPKKNWVDKVGGLPSYIERVAKHLHYEKGRPIGVAIATAINHAKKMCASGTAFGGKVKVSAKAQAVACKAVSEWEAKKARSKAQEAEFRELFEAVDAEMARARFELVVIEGLLRTLRDPGATASERRRAAETAAEVVEVGDRDPAGALLDATRDRSLVAGEPKPRVRLSEAPARQPTAAARADRAGRIAGRSLKPKRRDGKPQRGAEDFNEKHSRGAGGKFRTESESERSKRDAKAKGLGSDGLPLVRMPDGSLVTASSVKPTNPAKGGSGSGSGSKAKSGGAGKSDRKADRAKKDDKGKDGSVSSSSTAAGGRINPDLGYDVTRLVGMSVREWQRRNGLEPDGVVGPKTQAKLNEFRRKRGMKPVPYKAPGRRDAKADARQKRLREALDDARARRAGALDGFGWARARATELDLERRLAEADAKGGGPPWAKKEGKGDGDGKGVAGGDMKRCPSCNWRNPAGATKCKKCKAELRKKGDGKLEEGLAGGWRPHLHPRDRQGKWRDAPGRPPSFRAGDDVRTPAGHVGTITGRVKTVANGGSGGGPATLWDVKAKPGTRPDRPDLPAGHHYGWFDAGELSSADATRRLAVANAVVSAAGGLPSPGRRNALRNTFPVDSTRQLPRGARVELAVKDLGDVRMVAGTVKGHERRKHGLLGREVDGVVVKGASGRDEWVALPDVLEARRPDKRGRR